MMVTIPGYATIGRLVHLGRVNARTRRNASAAGLVAITAKHFRTVHARMTAGDRLMHCGIWYDTVKY